MDNLTNCLPTHTMQSEQTIDFVRRAKALLHKGAIKRKLDLAGQLDIGPTMLSNIFSGLKNITPVGYKKFNELYPPEAETLDYQRQLLESLIQQVQDLRSTLLHVREEAAASRAVLERENERLRSALELNSGRIREHMIINREYLKATYRNVVQARAAAENRPAKEIHANEDKLLAVAIQQSLGTDTV